MRARCRAPIWIARVTVGAVFVLNVSCALQFVFWPDRYAPSFELQGVAGEAMVRGVGILFLMWNATYPPVIWDPRTHRTLFAVVLIQQAIGVVGESWVWAALPAGHDALRATGLRFILFDLAGLVLMGIAFGLLSVCMHRQVPDAGEHIGPAPGPTH